MVKLNSIQKTINYYLILKGFIFFKYEIRHNYCNYIAVFRNHR